jgi:hypothetical protein
MVDLRHAMNAPPAPCSVCHVVDANCLALAHVYGEPPNAIAILGKRFNDEAEKIARLIISHPELAEMEREINKARNRRRATSISLCDSQRAR